MRHRITLLLSVFLGLCTAYPADAQKASSKGNRHAPKKIRKETSKLPTADITRPSAESVRIPQESSLSPEMKRTKKVVIVPAPPPPPGNDPIPPKRNP